MSANGFVVNNISLTIDTDGAGTEPVVEVNCAIMGVVWNTGDTTVQWQTACPDGYGAGDVKGTQSLDVNFAIDYSTDDTLTRVLDANHGKTAKVSWQPDPLNAPTYFLEGDVVLSRGTQTHTVGSVAAAQASWPCQGAGIVPVIKP